MFTAWIETPLIGFKKNLEIMNWCGSVMFELCGSVEDRIKDAMDHTEFMVLALQLYNVYWEASLGFASKNALAGQCHARVGPPLLSPCLLV